MVKSITVFLAYNVHVTRIFINRTPIQCVIFESELCGNILTRVTGHLR